MGYWSKNLRTYLCWRWNFHNANVWSEFSTRRQQMDTTVFTTMKLPITEHPRVTQVTGMMPLTWMSNMMTTISLFHRMMVVSISLLKRTTRTLFQTSALQTLLILEEVIQEPFQTHFLTTRYGRTVPVPTLLTSTFLTNSPIQFSSLATTQVTYSRWEPSISGLEVQPKTTLSKSTRSRAFRWKTSLDRRTSCTWTGNFQLDSPTPLTEAWTHQQLWTQ